MRPLFFWLLLALATPVMAANPKATTLARQGKDLYDAGKYKEAAELLKQAYELDPTPVLQFNLARAYDQAGDLQAALDSYRGLVGKPNVDPEMLKKSNVAMDRLRSLIARSETDKQINDAEKRRLESEAAAAKARADAEVEKARLQKLEYEAAEQKRKDEANHGASTRRLAAYGTAGGAVVFLGVGIGVGVAASSSKSAFVDASTVEDKQKYESQAKTRAAVADVFVIVGLAAAVTAVVLFPWGGDDPKQSVSVSLAPIQGGLVAGLGGHF